jgi:hypothetical protein
MLIEIRFYKILIILKSIEMITKLRISLILKKLIVYLKQFFLPQLQGN